MILHTVAIFFTPRQPLLLHFFLYIQTLSITIVTKSPGGKKYICNIMLSPILGFFSPAPTPPAVELYGVFTVEGDVSISERKKLGKPAGIKS